MSGLCRRRRILELLAVGIASFLLRNLMFFGYALNHEGKALLRFRGRIKDPFGALSSWEESSLETHHCSWFGVDCVDGHVVSLTLKDLCLEGTLAPELGHLVHIKLITLRNNSFSGVILEEIGALKELEVLDLGYNNFSGPLPHEWGNKISILLLDNNGLFCQVSPELEELMMISEVQVDESHLSPIDQESHHNVKLKASCAIAEHVNALHPVSMRRDLREEDPVIGRDLREIPPQFPLGGPPPPSPPPRPPPPASPPSVAKPPAPAPSVAKPPAPAPLSSTKSSHREVIIASASVGAFICLSLIVGLLISRTKKIATVGPWRTGLSGQLQRSFITDLPKLKRLEIDTACEEFSNVIGCSSLGTLYKGTLSGGTEIAVLSHAVKTSKDWSNEMELQFQKKVDTLSKLNHKNFLNLLGYCEEEKPFTRMLVFEYAPNGTLFEHLHVRESEHLNWEMRLRIAMGIAYCLEHMHELTPSIIHENLTTYAVNLTEDYATKLLDFGIWNEVALAGRPEPAITESINSPEISPDDNVYSFGLILLEMMTGKVPYCVRTGLLEEWTSDYLRSDKPLKDFVDPMLRHFDVAQLESISRVIKSCIRPNPQERPQMIEVASRLREITGLAPDRAAPRIMPLWWAEVALQSPHPENQAPSN